MATEAKRPRMDATKQHHSKGKTDKRNYYAKAADYRGMKPAYLEPSQRGFLVTCNMRERDCTRDAFRLLNEYADELYEKVGVEEQPPASKEPAGEEEEEEDISVQVQKQAEAAKTEKRQYRFQSVDTGAKNICFITTVLEDPTGLALKILRDAAETRKQKSRNIRLMPIEVVTKANLKDIMDGAGKLFDRYFLKEPKTFAVIFNRRFNNGLERESVINVLAEMISAKNRGNKANLKNPELAVIVEVIKGLVLISVVPEFSQLRKYNLMEICTGRTRTPSSRNRTSQRKGLRLRRTRSPRSRMEKVLARRSLQRASLRVKKEAVKGEEGTSFVIEG